MKHLSPSGDVPLVGILCGVTPERVVSVGNTLHEAVLTVMPGFVTPTEAFQAIKAGV